MKTKLTLVGLVAAFVLANCIWCPEAYAGRTGPRVAGIKLPRGGQRMAAPRGLGSSSMRIGRAPSFGGTSRRISTPGRPGGQRLGMSRPSGLPGRGGGGGLSRQGYGGLAGALLNNMALGGRGYDGSGGYGGYGGYGRGRLADYLLSERYGHHDDDYADAYRDVGIANAVVGLVGVILNAAQAAPVAAPQPVVRGHYETHKVVVREAQFVQDQVWVPPLYDSRTGAKIGGGFYETRTRLEPEVCEYQKVWVPE